MERFTKSKTMVFPREIIVGHNTTSQIAELCNRIGRGNSVLIVADKKTKKLSGDDIFKILKKANYEVKIRMVSKATVNEVNRLINYANKNNKVGNISVYSNRWHVDCSTDSNVSV